MFNCMVFCFFSQQKLLCVLALSSGSSVGEESTWNAGNPSTIPVSGRSAGDGIGYPLQYSWASLLTQLVKNLPAMWEIWVWSLAWEDPLGQGMVTHFSNSGLENSMDYIVRRVAKSWKRGSNFHTHITWMNFINSLFAIFCKVLPYALFPERFSYLRKCAYRLSAFGFLHISVGKESACNAEDSGLIPGWGRPLEKR